MPARPASFLTRFSSFALSLVVIAVLPLVGIASCGRSNLDDYLLGDGGGVSPESATDASDAHPQPEGAPACNSTTCPSGCCDATGTCQAGAALTQCGTLGEACSNCSAEGFQLCDPTRHACGNPVVSCDAQDCGGCCEGNVCFAGSDPNECGFSGDSCQHCANEGLACTNQQCVVPPCGPGNCNGCCFGDECLVGTAATACGVKGQVCSNCTANGTSCIAQGSAGGVCEGTTACSPSNCKGCCSGNVCVSGTAPTQCGELGQACSNCQATGGSCLSTGEGGICEGQTTCSPQNCPGCCEGNLCVSGSQPDECGVGGQICTDCAAEGGACVASGEGFGGFCEFEGGCGPGTCNGCCDQNGTCQGGTSASACGIDGSFCADCAVANGTCSGGLCNQPPPQCDASTCPSGCCDANKNCLPGDLTSFCGSGGKACQDCGVSGESCSKQSCVAVTPTCNASNCVGCCDSSSTCQAGFIDGQCGQGGASCEDCTQIQPTSVCDVSVSPRTCESQQVQCPAPYPSCPAGIETPSPTQQNVCSQTDLENANSACEGGAHSTACSSFFSFEDAENPACAKCLTPFDYDFSELTGLTTCVAPFADAACNHITGCLVDCTDQACAACADSGSLTACQNEVPNTVCSSYYNGAQCIDSAFFGGGSFCNPQTGLFGDWLGQVGQFYCAQ